jgi:ABC-type dipeptide/oligopeptide/nickel transport system permease component
VLAMAILYVILNLLIDLTYGIFDPRGRLGA